MNVLQLLLHLDRYLTTLTTHYGVWVYGLLFAIVFCETALIPLFFLPGNPLIFLSGALCATSMLNLGVLVVVLFCATVMGSAANYRLGRYLGMAVFDHDGASTRHRWLDRDALARTHAFYQRRGGNSLLVSLFIPVVRTFAPFVAGVVAMDASRFTGFTAAGAAIWVGVLAVGGYFFGNLPLIHDHFNAILFGGIGLVAVVLIVGGVWRKLSQHTSAP
jgi:membrane-associated protein